MTDSEFIHELLIKCEDCGEAKTDVIETTCPFNEEIHGESIPITVCGDCFQSRAEDI